MATLTVRNLGEDLVRRLRIRATEHLAQFRRRTAGRGSPPAAELLDEARAGRLRTLTGTGDGA